MLQWWGQWVKNRKIVLVIYSCNGKLSSSIGWNYYISFNIISYVNQVHVMDNLILLLICHHVTLCVCVYAYIYICTLLYINTHTYMVFSAIQCYFESILITKNRYIDFPLYFKEKIKYAKLLQQSGILFHPYTCIVTTFVEKLFLSEVEHYLCDHQVQYCYSYLNRSYI